MRLQTMSVFVSHPFSISINYYSNSINVARMYINSHLYSSVLESNGIIDSKRNLNAMSNE